jgi:hypothetical protein
MTNTEVRIISYIRLVHTVAGRVRRQKQVALGRPSTSVAAPVTCPVHVSRLVFCAVLMESASGRQMRCVAGQRFGKVIAFEGSFKC